MSSTSRAAVWAAVAEERGALAELLDGVDAPAWDAPSLCGGWRVREVVAHLVLLAEGTRASVLLGNLRYHPLPNAALDRRARAMAQASPADLVRRLRAAKDGRFVVPGLPPVVSLGEVLVHRADIREAAGLPVHPADERLRDVLEAERRFFFAFGAPPSVRRLRLVPTDGDWAVGPEDGRRVEAPGEDLLLVVTGRRAA